MKLKRQHFPKSKKALFFAALSGVFLAFDLAFWHESIYAVGPGISTLLNSLQIFCLAAIGFVFFAERQSKLQILSLFLAVLGVALISVEELQHNIDGIYGIVIGLISAVMLAGSMVMVKKSSSRRANSIISINVNYQFDRCFSAACPIFNFQFKQSLSNNMAGLGISHHLRCSNAVHCLGHDCLFNPFAFAKCYWIIVTHGASSCIVD